MAGQNPYAVAPGAYAASGMSYPQGAAMQSMGAGAMGGGLGDLKGPLAGFAMNMLQKQMSPQHPQLQPIQPLPVFTNRGMGQLLPLYPHG